MNNKDIENIVNQVLEAINNKNIDNSKDIENNSDDELKDISDIKLSEVSNIPNMHNEEAFKHLRGNGDARLGVWRAGSRYLTETLLRYQIDNAASMDAVFTDVDENIIKSNNLFPIQTVCEDKDEYLTRPDLGRKLSPETEQSLKDNCSNNPEIQIIVSGGLSSTAVESNIDDLLPSIEQGLKNFNLSMGNPIFVKYARVPVMDAITEILNAKITCILIGERPGLSTSESLSAYMTYNGFVGMPEADRVIISNIHSNGTNPVEAGALIAELMNNFKNS